MQGRRNALHNQKAAGLVRWRGKGTYEGQPSCLPVVEVELDGRAYGEVVEVEENAEGVADDFDGDTAVAGLEGHPGEVNDGQGSGGVVVSCSEPEEVYLVVLEERAGVYEAAWACEQVGEERERERAGCARTGR